MSLRTAGKSLLQSYRHSRKLKRMERMRTNITKTMKGLEIGPSHCPCAPKGEGYDVEGIDYLDQAGLIAKYRALGVDTTRIESVDYIWDGRPYSEITGKKEYYDYIIASHVIEHTTDFIGFLRDCSSMLKSTGVLNLAVPDKRYTLDHFRMVTTLGKVIDDEASQNKNGSIGTYMDYLNYAVVRGQRTSWPKWTSLLNRMPYAFANDFAHSGMIYRAEKDNLPYHDIHRYVFTPASFELLIEDLNQMGLIDLDMQMVHKSSEFIVSLHKGRKRGAMTPEERKRLIQRVSRENVVR